MMRYFNITGSCNQQEHYMVNLESRLVEIKRMIDRGKYFCINRGRQYGKTTILRALKRYLHSEYIVVILDFQGFSLSDFQTETSFVEAFARELDNYVIQKNDTSEELLQMLKRIAADTNELKHMGDLFKWFSLWCKTASKPVVLLIDEVDQASNNQVFLDFLAQLRRYYLERTERPTFKSVILAGVHDIRNLRPKIRSDAEHKHNGPWNIAAAFDVDMSFSPADIGGMLNEYENDHNTGMNIPEIAQLIYDYTSGYPVLVSNICKLNDEKIERDIRWTSEGIVKAVGGIVSSRQMLFDSLMNKLEDDDELRDCVYNILMKGSSMSYSPYDESADYALMYGFVKIEDGIVKIANRIFETVLYNFFLTTKQMQDTPTYKAGSLARTQFVNNGELDMELILEKFILHFNVIYGNETEGFKEDEGRKLFLLYLRPIINGVGNYYIEAQTRDQRRTDVIVDYLGKQYIIELKIWRGDEYNTQGEKQLSEYLDYYHTDKGYMLIFNFNKQKKVGVERRMIGDKVLIEAVV